MNRLKLLRQSRGMMQKDIAAAINKTPSAYNQYESGKRAMDIDTLKLLSNLFGVSIDYILGNDLAIPDPANEPTKYILSPTEQELLVAFKTLTDENKYKVLGMIRLLQYEQSTQQDEAPSAAG